MTEDYTAAFQDFDFNNFNGSESIIDDGVLSSTPGSNSTITVKAKDAGDYTITFTAQEGYKYRSIPSYAVSIPKKGDSETIIGVQYTIHINKVNLTSVTFTLPATSWDYDGTTAGHEPTGLVAVGVGSESINFETAGEDGAVTVTWEYRVKDGETLPHNKMPTDAGKYQVRAVLSGLKNYNDSNELCEWQDFEILSKEVALPTLAQDSFPYTGKEIEPSINHGIDSWGGVYTVTNEGGTDRGEYDVEFKLTSTNNYHWAPPGAGEGIVSGDGKYYTLTWEITQAQNRVEGEPSVPSWIYNEDGIQGDDVKPQIDVHFTNSGEEPAYHYSYKGWNDGDYSDITDKVNDGDWEWDAGYYQVWVTYRADTSEYGNFAAFTSDRYDFTVFRMFVEKPNADELEGSSFEYNEKEQNISDKIPNYEANKSRYTLAGEKGTNAGDYEVTLTLNPNYQWGKGSSDENTSDDDIAAVSFGWKITRKVISEPTLSDGGTTVYSAAGNSVEVEGFLAQDGANQTYMILSGDKLSFADGTVTAVGEGGVIAGDYTIKVTLGDNYCFAAEDNSKFGDELYTELTWKIQRQGVEQPSEIQKDFTYDKTEKKYSEDSPAYDVAGYKQGDASPTPIDAGVYDVVFRLDSNYCWGDNGSNDTADFTLTGGMVINRATVKANPEMEGKNTDGSLADGTYNEKDQTKTATGYDAEKMSVTAAADEDGDTIAKNVNGSEVTFRAKNAGSYKITFELLDSKNYTWATGGVTDPAQENKPTIVFTWTINKAPNAVLSEESDTYAGWKYGEDVTKISDLGLYAEFDDELLNDGAFVYEYFAKSDASFQNKIEISSETPVGNYVLRVTIFEFTIEKNTVSIKGSVNIEKPELANKNNWFYRDSLDNHALTYLAMVGETDITDDASQVKYYRVIEGGDELISRDDLATADAGKYKVVIEIADTDNYTGDSFEIAFTIQKFKVEIPVFVDSQDRLHEYDEGDVDGWKPEIPKPTEEDRGAVWEVEWLSGDNSKDVGNYWFTLTLTDPDNYEWGEWTPQTAPGTEEQDEVAGAVAKLWFRITQTQFDMNLSLAGWTYGTAHNQPSYTHPEGKIPNEYITFSFTGTPNGGGSFNESGTPDTVVWPTQAGTYTLTVSIEPYGNYDYGTDTVEFTIARATLTLKADVGTTAVYGSSPSSWAGYVLVGGLVDGDNLEDVLAGVVAEFTYSAPGYTAGESGVGFYDVAMDSSVEEVANYTLTFDDATDALEITKLGLRADLFGHRDYRGVSRFEPCQQRCAQFHL